MAVHIIKRRYYRDGPLQHITLVTARQRRSAALRPNRRGVMGWELWANLADKGLARLQSYKVHLQHPPQSFPLKPPPPSNPINLTSNSTTMASQSAPYILSKFVSPSSNAPSPQPSIPLFPSHVPPANPRILPANTIGDPLFALLIGSTAAFVRIRREEKEKYPDKGSVSDLVETGRRRVGREWELWRSGEGKSWGSWDGEEI
jgi:hypothetical protein